MAWGVGVNITTASDVKDFLVFSKLAVDRDVVNIIFCFLWRDYESNNVKR